jgi:hypothetical protein
MPYIKTERQQRAITALVKYNKLGCHELQKNAGQINIPELIAGLRRNGWKIDCERVEVLDRDGKKCRPGLYFLLPESLEIARKMVKEWEGATSQAKRKPSINQSNLD